MLTDSHCHLEMKDFDSDREQVIARARSAGVGRIVTVGTTLRDCRKAVSLAEKTPGVYAAVGIHPHGAGRVRPADYDELKKLADHPKVVAWGEIGLDFFRDLSPRKIQVYRFEEQLDIAEELGLPIVIHDREAHGEVLSIIEKRPGCRKGVFHCFSGDYEMAKKCLDFGFHLSVPGTVTYPKSERLREVVRKAPLESLLIETDAPYLTPQPYRGKRNEPAHVALVAEEVARIRGISPGEAGQAASDNAARLFSLSAESA